MKHALLSGDDSVLPELNPAELNSVKWDWLEDKVVEIASIGKCFPLEQQRLYAEMMVWDLNEQIAYDGRWRAIWRNPVKSQWDTVSRMFKAYVPTVIEFQWLDKDGAIKLTADIDQPIDRILSWGELAVMEQLTQGYQQMLERDKLLDVASMPTFNAAAGQKPTNAIEQFAQD